VITKLVIVNTNVELIADYQRPPNARSYISDIVASDLLHPSNITSRIIVAKWPLSTTFVFGPVDVRCALNCRQLLWCTKPTICTLKWKWRRFGPLFILGKLF